MTARVITLFGSSRPIEEDKEYRIAYEVGKELARAGYTICNGGYGGIMEASARGAKDAGGICIGVTVEVFQHAPHRWIDVEHRTANLMERLKLLIDLASGYIVLKGGTGTLLEFSCVWELMNKKLMAQKPLVIVGAFWEKVIETIREEEGALGGGTNLIHRVQLPDAVPPYLSEWFSKNTSINP
jgi:uncharacterized protein (TIGR00725 family)